MRCRREHAGLFSEGEYLPAETSVPFTDNVCGFVRRRGDTTALVAVPRLLSEFVQPGENPIGAVWRDSVLFLPPDVVAQRWRDVFTGTELTTVLQDGRQCLPLREVFGSFPLSLLMADASRT